MKEKILIDRAASGYLYIRITNGFDYLHVYIDPRKTTVSDIFGLIIEFLIMVNESRRAAIRNYIMNILGEIIEREKSRSYLV